MKKISLILSLVALITSIAMPAWADGEYYPAVTAPQKALDKIFQRDSTDGDMIDYMVGFPGRDTASDYEFAHMVTPALVENTRLQERAMVQRTCNGHYRDAEVCGFDFDTISCAPDIADSLYKTKEETADTALIYAVPRDMASAENPRQYRLVNRGGVWLLDGVFCPAGGRFNWK